MIVPLKHTTQMNEHACEGMCCDDADAIHSFVHRLQKLAGLITHCDIDSLAGIEINVVHLIPTVSSRAAKVVCDALVGEARQMCRVEIARRQALFKSLVNERQLVRDRGHHPPDVRAAKSLIDHVVAILNEKYVKPDLRAEAVARELRVSVCHMVRMLKRCTGHGYRWHLRAIRVTRARLLLRVSQLSIKEVAGACGYKSTSELDRQFTAVVGVVPSDYRWRTRYEAKGEEGDDRKATRGRGAGRL